MIDMYRWKVLENGKALHNARKLDANFRHVRKLKMTENVLCFQIYYTNVKMRHNKDITNANSDHYYH